MDFDLSDEQQLIRDTARDFTDNEIVPVAGVNSRNHHFDVDLIKKIAAQGYLGAIVPQEYGGAGLGYVSYGVIGEEIGRGCSGMRTVISVQTSLVCSTILRSTGLSSRRATSPRAKRVKRRSVRARVACEKAKRATAACSTTRPSSCAVTNPTRRSRS